MTEQRFDRLVPVIYLFCDDLDSEGLLPVTFLEDFCVDFDVFRVREKERFIKDVVRMRPDMCMLFLRPGNEDLVRGMIAEIHGAHGGAVPVAVLAETRYEGLASLVKAAGAQAVLTLPATAATVATCIAPYANTTALTRAMPGLGVTAPAPAVAVTPSSAEAAPPAEEEAPPAPRKEASLSPVVDWLFSSIMPTLNAIEESLENLDSAEAQVAFYQKKLLPHKDDFIRMIKAKRRNDNTEPDYLQCLRLYGVSSLRKLVVAQKLLEITGARPLRWDPTSGQLATDPKTVIPFAAQMAEYYDESSAYRQIAFNSGLVLDVLMHASAFAPERKGAIKSMIETSVRTIQAKTDVGIKKAKSINNLAYGKHILTTLTMREAGRIAMAIYFKDYMARRGRYEKKEVPPALQQLVETRNYSVSHNVVGALICQNTPGFAVVHKAVLFCNTPVLLKGLSSDQDSYTLAALCHSL